MTDMISLDFTDLPHEKVKRLMVVLEVPYPSRAGEPTIRTHFIPSYCPICNNALCYRRHRKHCKRRHIAPRTRPDILSRRLFNDRLVWLEQAILSNYKAGIDVKSQPYHETIRLLLIDILAEYEAGGIPPCHRV